MSASNWKKDALRKYQLEGAEWLVDLPAKMRGRLLTDGLGLGKSRTALAAHRLREEAGMMQFPCGMVFTTSISTHDWRREAEKFWPELTVHVLGSESAYQRKNESDADFEKRRHGKWQDMLLGKHGPSLLISSYEGAERIDDFITSNDILIDSLTIDEAHNMKRASTSRASTLKTFVGRAKQTTLMTATAVHNRPPDLHNLLTWMDPKTPGYWKWANKFFLIHAPDKGFGPGTVGELLDKEGLNESIAHLVMGRTSEEVFGQMPARQRVLKLIDAPGAERISPAKLHQFKEETGIQSACSAAVKYKLDAAVSLVEDMDQPVVLYAYRREDAKKLHEKLLKVKVSSLLATGDSTSSARDKIIERWKAGEATALVCTLDAVRESATLTRAAVMVFVDLSWLPGTMLQCEGRIDPARQQEGNRRPVTYYYLVTKDGPDEVVAEMLVEKIEQASGIGSKNANNDALGDFLSPLDKRVKLKDSSPDDLMNDLMTRLTSRANRLAELGML